jgi:hypothetical protein
MAHQRRCTSRHTTVCVRSNVVPTRVARLSKVDRSGCESVTSHCLPLHRVTRPPRTYGPCAHSGGSALLCRAWQPPWLTSGGTVPYPGVFVLAGLTHRLRVSGGSTPFVLCGGTVSHALCCVALRERDLMAGPGACSSGGGASVLTTHPLGSGDWWNPST